VISGLIFGYRAVLRLWALCQSYIWSFIRHPGIHKIAIEFCTEVAVLVAVFPILDTIIPITGGAQASGQNGMKNVTWPLVITSEGIAGLFLILAGIMSIKGGKD
jgi:hypothetical protein